MVDNPAPADEAWEEDPYAMANLRPADTGLPMTVWVSERAGAPHDVRVKVCTVHSSRMLPASTASVAMRPAPRVVVGQLSPDDFQAVSRWISLNEATIIDYWDGAIGTGELMRRLRRLP
jgi:hypothetical protein